PHGSRMGLRMAMAHQRGTLPLAALLAGWPGAAAAAGHARLGPARGDARGSVEIKSPPAGTGHHDTSGSTLPFHDAPRCRGRAEHRYGDCLLPQRARRTAAPRRHRLFRGARHRRALSRAPAHAAQRTKGAGWKIGADRCFRSDGAKLSSERTALPPHSVTSLAKLARPEQGPLFLRIGIALPRRRDTSPTSNLAIS